MPLNIKEQVPNPDIKSIIHLINLHGKNLVGMELGTHRGESFLHLLQCCPNIKTLHGCDHYEAFTDYITTPYPTGAPAYSVDQQTQDWNEMLCRFYIKHSGNEHKAILHKKKSMDLINEFEDNYFDFIFIDTYLSEEQIREEIPAWYKKVKNKGIFAGHDWNFIPLQNYLHQFRKANNITATMSVYDNTFCWIKNS